MEVSKDVERAEAAEEAECCRDDRGPQRGQRAVEGTEDRRGGRVL
jgi:hypothetical protein